MKNSQTGRTRLIILITALVFLFFLWGCQKEAEVPPPTHENVSLKWPTPAPAFEDGAVIPVVKEGAASGSIELQVYGFNSFFSGNDSSLRIIVFQDEGLKPVKGATVKAELQSPDKTLTLIEGKTDEKGTLPGTFNIPENLTGGATLKVTAEANQEKKELSFAVNIEELSGKIFLSTDKPLYQPGQEIHIRTLALQNSSQKPVYPGETLFEVEDSKGNKVFKKKVENSEFGIASTTFLLAREVNMGAYKIRAISEEMTSEINVTVKKYVLPKFKVELETERESYMAGQELKGTIQSDYFFGKPVSGGEVEINLLTYDGSYNKFQTIKGTTDKEGLYKFEATIPENFNTDALLNGDTLVKCDVTIKDKADHKEKTSIELPIVKSPIMVQVMPECKNLVPKLENKIYLLTYYPDGAPAKCNVEITSQDQQLDTNLKTDDGGFAEFNFTPEPGQNIQLTVKASDSAGLEVTSDINLSSTTQEKSLILRTDKSIYNGNEKINLDLLTTMKNGTVFLDFLKENQVLSTTTVSIEEGKGSIEISPEVSGSINLKAYTISPDGNLVQDIRALYVNPDDLSVGVTLDKKTYLPGEEATLDFVVKDKDKGVPAALSVKIVDESLFALAEENVGLAKLFFNLKEEFSEPDFKVAEKGMEELIEKNEDASYQKLAAILMAEALETESYTIAGNTFAEKLSKIHQDFQSIFNGYINYLSAYGFSKGFPESIETLIESGYLGENQAYDPWGRPYLFGPQYPQLVCVGADGIKGTNDDVDSSGYFQGGAPVAAFPGAVAITEEEIWAMDKMERDVVAFNIEAEGMPVDQNFAAPPSTGEVHGETKKTQTEGGAKPVKVRDYFPETLYYNPQIITDENGLAFLTLPMADSITTWRLSSMVSSLEGVLGQAEGGIKVFQDFFIDLDLPVSMTQNDEFSLPVAIYNYLPESQKITLEIEKGDWFELKDESVKVVNIDKNDVTVEYFRLKAKDVGNHKFTLLATGSKMSDAIKKTVEVRPDGKEYIICKGDRLTGNVSAEIDIPDNAIKDASKIFVTIYPGIFSQIAEGMESIFQMPYG